MQCLAAWQLRRTEPAREARASRGALGALQPKHQLMLVEGLEERGLRVSPQTTGLTSRTKALRPSMSLLRVRGLGMKSGRQARDVGLDNVAGRKTRRTTTQRQLERKMAFKEGRLRRFGGLERQSEDGLPKCVANDWLRDLWSRASTHHSSKYARESSGCLELPC